MTEIGFPPRRFFEQWRSNCSKANNFRSFLCEPHAFTHTPVPRLRMVTFGGANFSLMAESDPE